MQEPLPDDQTLFEAAIEAITPQLVRKLRKEAESKGRKRKATLAFTKRRVGRHGARKYRGVERR